MISLLIGSVRAFNLFTRDFWGFNRWIFNSRPWVLLLLSCSRKLRSRGKNHIQCKVHFHLSPLPSFKSLLLRKTATCDSIQCPFTGTFMHVWRKYLKIKLLKMESHVQFLLKLPFLHLYTIVLFEKKIFHSCYVICISFLWEEKRTILSLCRKADDVRMWGASPACQALRVGEP